MAYHPEDCEQLRPSRKAGPRLRGLGIVSPMRGTRLSPKLSEGERAELEDRILRARGVPARLIPAVRAGHARLRVQRHRGTAEHTVTAVEEGSHRRKGTGRAHENAGAAGRPDPNPDAPTPSAPGQPDQGVGQRLPFRFACAAGCGAITAYASKPCALPSGGWPNQTCVQCNTVARIGNTRCADCGRTLSACKCVRTQGQSSLRRFFNPEAGS